MFKVGQDQVLESVDAQCLASGKWSVTKEDLQVNYECRGRQASTAEIFCPNDFLLISVTDMPDGFKMYNGELLKVLPAATTSYTFGYHEAIAQCKENGGRLYEPRSDVETYKNTMREVYKDTKYRNIIMGINDFKEEKRLFLVVCSTLLIFIFLQFQDGVPV